VEIYLVRHAIAAQRDPDRWPDDGERPLTAKGEARFQRVAKGLGRVVPSVERVFSSPLVRAWRTAEILNEVIGWPTPAKWSQLEPDRAPAQAVLALGSQADATSVALVGHEPHLSELASYLLAGSTGRVEIEMKKGGVACLAADEVPRPGDTLLRWVLTPRILRSL
jgi:phosphohistidine phosphatase